MKKMYSMIIRKGIFAGAAMLFLAIWLATPVTGQVSVNKDGSQADPSALLDVKGTDGGLLIPRMTTTQMNAIGSPATGLMVYNTSDNTFYFYTGASWNKVEGAAEADGVIGNEVLDATANGGLFRSGAGTGASPYTLGISWGGNGAATTASRSDHSHANMVTGSGTATRVTFWNGTNSLSSNANLYWDNGNNRLGVGTTAPTSEVDVNGTQNSALVSQATAAHMFVHLTNTAEVNGEGPGIGFSNSSVTDNIGAKIVHIRTGAQSTGDLAFYTKNSTTVGDYTTEKMRLTAAGNVGIGVTAPTQPLHVQGNQRLTGALYDVNNQAGTSGQLLSSTGTGIDWIANPSPTGSGVENKVAFWTGANTLSYNTNFHWDNANGRLGVGTSAPLCRLHVNETVNQYAAYVASSVNTDGYCALYGYQSASGNATNHVAGVYGRAYGSTQPNSYGVAGHNFYGGIGVGAWSYTGDLMRAYSGDWPGGTLQFYITNAGNAYINGGWWTFKGVPSKGPNEHVALVGTQSPEALIEDCGTAQMVNGQATVQIDETFAEITNTGSNYQVFLTPVSEEIVMLVVSNKTSASFTVKGETKDGKPATCGFDYRIVARDNESKAGRFEGVDIPEPVEVPRED